MTLFKKMVLALCLCLYTSLLYAQLTPITKTYTATPLPGGILASSKPTMPLVIPLFIEGNHFVSSLTLVNNSTAATFADVTLRGLDGETIASRRLDFAPHSQRRVEVGNVLDSKGSNASAGSILVMQSSTLAGPAILGVLSMTYTGSSDPNYIDEEPFVPDMKGSQVLQGVADRGDESPILAISSLATTAQVIQIQCLGNDGPSVSRKLQLAAGETVLTDACAGTEIPDTDLNSLFEGSNSTARGPQGIRLVSDIGSGSFAAFALAPHEEKGNRFFSGVLFSDPRTINSPNTVFTGVPVGAATALPAGNYIPELTLANFSSKDINVHTTFARTSDGAPSTQEIGAITVPSRSTRELVLGALRGDSALQNSFVVHSDGAAGDLMAKFVSRGDSRLHEVELQAKDEADIQNGGAHPWSIEQGTESTLLLFNHSIEQQTFTVRVSSGGVDWQKEYKLASMETEAIRIRDLIYEQVKDDKGKTLPKDATSGETSWLVVDVGKGSGRLLQSDRAAGMARNFSCGYSGLLCGSSINIIWPALPDGAVEEFGSITGITCTSGQPNACSGQQTGTANFSSTWQSLSPSVASISGSSTSPSVNLLGLSAGTSQVNGEVRSSYCQSGGGGSAKVQVPTSLSVPTLSAVMTQTTGPVKDYYGQTVITTNECGVYRYANSDLLDQSGAKILTNGDFTLTEMFSNYTTTVTGLTVPPTQSSTQNTSTQQPSDTQFFGTRAPACPGPNDHEGFNQSFSVTLNGKNYPLTTVRQISRGYFNGTPNVTITTTTK
jgi:hypothetical protein